MKQYTVDRLYLLTCWIGRLMNRCQRFLKKHGARDYRVIKNLPSRADSMTFDDR